MKILLYGMAESGLSTLFNQFKLLPNSVPLLSQNNPATSSNNSIESSSLTDTSTTNTNNNTTTAPSSPTTIKQHDENNNNTFSSPEEDETPITTLSDDESKQPQLPTVPSQALKPSLKRPTISPLQFTPPPSSTNNNNRKTNNNNNNNSDILSFQSSTNPNVKFLKRRKQAFNEHFLKNLPNAFLSQLLISFKLLIHHAERKELLFLSEDDEKFQEFLRESIVKDTRLESNGSLLTLSSLISNSNNNLNLLKGQQTIVASSSSLSTFSDVETLVVPPSNSNIITNNIISTSNTKELIAKFNGKEDNKSTTTSSSSSTNSSPTNQHHHQNIKFESKYKGVRNDLEKILKEQQKEFIEPLKKEKNTHQTRQRSLSENLLVSQIKKLKQKRGKDDEYDYSQLLPPATSSSSNKNTALSTIFSEQQATSTTTEEDVDTSSSSEECKHQLPPHYCEHCQKMAHAKLKVKPSEKIQYQYMDWKIENTKVIVERIKKITDINQLYGVRLRSEFFKDLVDLWENHIGLQHCFHSYSIFKSPDGGNIFSSLPAIMKWIVKKYLLNMPTKCFNFDKQAISGMESHASELGEDIATSCESIPPEMALLLNTNFNVVNSTASARDYKFKFEVPASTNFQELKISVSSSLITSSPSTSNSSSPVGSPDWNILGSSFTVPNDNYSKSDSELEYSVNSGLYALSKYRASTAMNKDVISAIRPLVLEEKKKEERDEKKSSMSPRRLFSFFKSAESANEQAAPPTKPEKKMTKKIKKQDTFSVFSVITMGGISPKVSFLKNEWIMCCYASNMVLFAVNLCDYFKTILVKSEFSDQLTEKKKISYSLEKFEQCANGKYFSELPIVLCFTFVDVFEQAQHYHPLTDKQKSEIEQIVQQLNPASYGQKKTESTPLNIHTKLDQKRKPWHDSCEFIIQQYIHLATTEQRRKQVRDSFVVLNCIDTRKTAQVLVNDVLFNEDILANELETETSQTATGKVNDGSKSDRSHYRKPPDNEKNTQPDYTQYYLRRCKTTNTGKDQQPAKIGKQRKSINRKGGEKLKQELTKNKRLSWSNNGSIKLKKPEENIIVLDEYANEDDEAEEPSTARRRRKNSYQCSLQ